MSKITEVKIKCLLPSGPCKTEYFLKCKKSDKCENPEVGSDK
jgi:hypothetical protein